MPAPAVQRAELLDRRCASPSSASAGPARHARDPVRAQALPRDQAQHGDRVEHPQRPAVNARRVRASEDAGRRATAASHTSTWRRPRARLSARSCPPCCAGATTTPPRREETTRASRCTFPAATTRTRGCTAATAGSRSVQASCSRAGPGASPKQIADGILPKTVSLGESAWGRAGASRNGSGEA